MHFLVNSKMSDGRIGGRTIIVKDHKRETMNCNDVGRNGKTGKLKLSLGLE